MQLHVGDTRPVATVAGGLRYRRIIPKRRVVKKGICDVEETEKGWMVSYIDRDPETLKRQENRNKKEKQSFSYPKVRTGLYLLRKRF